MLGLMGVIIEEERLEIPRQTNFAFELSKLHDISHELATPCPGEIPVHWVARDAVETFTLLRRAEIARAKHSVGVA